MHEVIMILWQRTCRCASTQILVYPHIVQLIAEPCQRLWFECHDWSWPEVYRSAVYMRVFKQKHVYAHTIFHGMRTVTINPSYESNRIFPFLIHAGSTMALYYLSCAGCWQRRFGGDSPKGCRLLHSLWGREGKIHKLPFVCFMLYSSIQCYMPPIKKFVAVYGSCNLFCLSVTLCFCAQMKAFLVACSERKLADTKVMQWT
jgi:hypothetical protein